MARIFHITALEDWEKAQAKNVYDFDALKTDGFIHCSTREQVGGVAHSIFKGRTDLVLLEIDEKKVKAEIKYENCEEEGEEKFPHIYGPLNIDAIVKVHEFQPNMLGEFELPKS